MSTGFSESSERAHAEQQRPNAVEPPTEDDVGDELAQASSRLPAQRFELIDAAILSVLTVFAAIRAFGPISDNSYFTQMSNGRFALDSGSWPETDVWTDSPGRWIAPGRLSSLFFAVSDSLTSGAAGRLVATLSVCATVMMVWRLLGSLSLLGRATIATAFVLGEFAFISQRAQTTGLMLFTLVLLLIAERREKALLFFAPVFVLWINWHGSWALGLAVVVAAAVLHRWYKVAVAATAATLIGALISPYGLDLLLVPFEHVGKSNLSYIIEWRHPALFELHTLMWLALWAGAIVVSVRFRSSLPATSAVLIAGYGVVFLVAGYSAQRNIMFGLPVAVWAISVALSSRRQRDLLPAEQASGIQREHQPTGRVAWSAAVLTAALLSGLVVSTDSYDFPSAPAALVDLVPAGQTVFTDLDTGAFIQVTRGPEVQLYIDDRGEIHSEEKFRLWDQFRDGDAAVVNEISVDLVLWTAESETYAALDSLDTWMLVASESLDDGSEMGLFARR